MFPLTEELSYLLGVLFGDGQLLIRPESRTHQFRLKSIDMDFIEEVNRCLLAVIGRSGKIYENDKSNSLGKNKQTVLVLCSKEFVEYLDSLTCGVTVIPSFILKDRGVMIRQFVAGLFDSDGWIAEKKGGESYQLGIAKTKSYLDTIMAELIRMSVRWSRRIKNPVGISKIDQIHYNVRLRDFVEKGFYFKINRKQKRLNDYKRNVLKQDKI